jgi:hypothetical protein
MPGRAREPRDAAAGDSVDVVSRTYHTVDGVPHAEGETYAVTTRALAETLRGIGFVSIVGWTEGPIAPPTITALAPATAAVGAADFTLTVTGTEFGADSVVVWDGGDLGTTVTSPTEVTAPVVMATATEGVIPVQVRSSGNLSDPASFTVTATRRTPSDPTPPRYSR